MTSAEQEATLIALWGEGLAIAPIAQSLGIPKGTVQSRAHRLQQRGLIQPRPKGGPIPGRRPWPGREAEGCQPTPQGRQYGCHPTPHLSNTFPPARTTCGHCSRIFCRSCASSPGR